MDAIASIEDTSYGSREGLAERYRRIRDDPDREARWAAWQAENAAAIAASNAWVEEHGLPLARYSLP